ncbi:MAG: AAA family ATPase [Methylocystaceae bacterium]|nr:AAA family ATPase [Methylocystaceae bacterium]
MQISFVDIQNYRRLKQTRIGLSSQQTIFVGANNSGKTSAMDALISFLTDKSSVTYLDFTLSNWDKINQLGEDWFSLTEEAEDRKLGIEFWHEVCPSIDIWFNVNQNELHRISHLLPTIFWEGGQVGVRLSFEPKGKDVEKSVEKLQSAFIEQYLAKEEVVDKIADENKRKNINLWPINLQDFLKKKLNNYFDVAYYKIDPTKIDTDTNVPQKLSHPKEQHIKGLPLTGLLKVNSINAQRGFSDAKDGNGSMDGKGDKKLSRQLSQYYKKHLNIDDVPTEQDLDAITGMYEAKAIQNTVLENQFKDVTAELESLGYPGIDNPKIIIDTEFDAMEAFQSDAAIQYNVSNDGGKVVTLPEAYNGLGYQNLIYMFFKLKRFRDGWMKVGKAKPKSGEELSYEPIHLVLVEEPEAHLHAQVQQVFTRQAYTLLGNHPELSKENTPFNTQMIISTHSSHVAHESEYKNLRYFRRVSASNSCPIPTSVVENMSDVFGANNNTAKYVARYIKMTHSDLFFADAAILVEGAAERMLVPHFIRQNHKELLQKYITLFEVNGAHAHKLKPLIDKMHLTTLIITDLDSEEEIKNDKGDTSWKAQPPKLGLNQRTNNDTLKSWLPKKGAINELFSASQSDKIIVVEGKQSVCVAYQTPVSVDTGVVKEELCPYTFEDAIVLSNTNTFKNTSENGFFKKAKNHLETCENGEDLQKSLFESVRKMNKGDFAQALLFSDEIDNISAPPYISKGLSWLLSALNLQAGGEEA